MLAGLIASRRRWATDAFFDILYGDSDPALQALAAESLHEGLQRLTVDKSGYVEAACVDTVLSHCVKSGRFDVLREMLKRGSPPNYPETHILPGAATESGRWLDMLSSCSGNVSSFPQSLQRVWRSAGDAALAEMAALLADVDPGHGGTDCLAGTEWGAVFFEVVMKRAVAASQDSVPVVAPGPVMRRRLGV